MSKAPEYELAVHRFLFPIKINKIEKEKREFIITARFGKLSYILWEIFCILTYWRNGRND